MPSVHKPIFFLTGVFSVPELQYTSSLNAFRILSASPITINGDPSPPLSHIRRVGILWASVRYAGMHGLTGQSCILDRIALITVVAMSSARSASSLLTATPPYLAVTTYLDNLTRSASVAPVAHPAGSSRARDNKSCINSGSVPDTTSAAFMAFSAAC